MEPKGECWELNRYCNCRACKGGPNRHTRAFINYLRRQDGVKAVTVVYTDKIVKIYLDTAGKV